MNRLRRTGPHSSGFWLAVLALLSLLQGLQPLLHAHPRGEDIRIAPGPGPAAGFALHLPDSGVTHALAERAGPAPVTVTAEDERCRAIDGWSMPTLAPPSCLIVAAAPDGVATPDFAAPRRACPDPVPAHRSPRGPPAA